ncbi:MAG: PEP-CTERM sorting domain-containing protein [Planctomycetota bacterium]
MPEPSSLLLSVFAVLGGLLRFRYKKAG